MVKIPDDKDYGNWSPDECFAWAERQIANWTEGEALDLNPNAFNRTFALRELPIEFQSLRKLTHLSLAGTQISDFSQLAHLNNLIALNLNGTKISNASPLADLNNLTNLNLGNTGVSDASPLADLNNLTNLNLGSTGVSDASPLADLNTLTTLDLSGTQISDVKPLADFSNLTTLNLIGTQISDIKPLVDLNNLTTLNLIGTQISDIKPLVDLNNLTTLYLGATQISDISPLADLINLTSLFLWSTPISNVAPLADLQKLVHLDLENTAVQSIGALQFVTNLEQLDLWDCQIEDIWSLLDGFDHLNHLTLNKSSTIEIPNNVISEDNADNCLPRLRDWLSNNPIAIEEAQASKNQKAKARVEDAVANAQLGRRSITAVAGRGLILAGSEEVELKDKRRFDANHEAALAIIQDIGACGFVVMKGNRAIDVMAKLMEALGDVPKNYDAEFAAIYGDQYLNLLRGHTANIELLAHEPAPQKRARTDLAGSLESNLSQMLATHPKGQEVIENIERGSRKQIGNLETRRKVFRDVYSALSPVDESAFAPEATDYLNLALNLPADDPSVQATPELERSRQLQDQIGNTAVHDSINALTEGVVLDHDEQTRKRSRETLDRAEPLLEKSGMFPKVVQLVKSTKDYVIRAFDGKKYAEELAAQKKASTQEGQIDE